MTQQTIDSRLGLARQIAVSAGKATLKYFRQPELNVEIKSDGSPLTQADRLAETMMRDEIAAAFRFDEIVGEEFGISGGSSGWQWILDPIDGTKSFITGVPLFGTMVGVARDGRSEIGVIYFPALDQGMYAWRGGGCWYFESNQDSRRAQVSNRSRMSQTIFVNSAVETFDKRGARKAYDELSKQVFFSRTWGDAYGYMLVALGQADIMIDPILSIWDAAAVQPIIEEAGGRFSDWQGASRIDSGDAIGTNGIIHDEVLRIIRSSQAHI